MYLSLIKGTAKGENIFGINIPLWILIFKPKLGAFPYLSRYWNYGTVQEHRGNQSNEKK